MQRQASLLQNLARTPLKRPQAPQQTQAPQHTYAIANQCLWRLGQRFGVSLRKIEAESLLLELAAIAGLLILPWIGIAVALHYAYDSAEAAAFQSTANLARALEESARRTFDQIDYVLLSARTLRAAQGSRFDFDDWARKQTFLKKMTAQMAIADRTGTVTGTTIPNAPSISLADRSHFKAQVDLAHDDLFISHPVTGRASGRQSIQFSRKLLGPDDTFDGIVVFSLETVELAQFSAGQEIGKGFVAILATDGTILERGPSVPGLNGTSIAETPEFHGMLGQQTGSLRLAGTPARIAQIASFRRLSEYPVSVMVGFDTETVFASYRSLRNNALLSGAAVSLALGLLGFFWMRLKRRSLVSRRALTVALDTISQGILMVDGQGGVSVINPRVLDLLTWPDETPQTAMRLVATRATELIPGPMSPHSHPSVTVGAAVVRQDGKIETTLENGTIIEVRTHLVADGGFVQTYTDVTEQRLAHARVQHLAHHDALTGLANRIELRQQLTEIVAHGVAPETITALIMIDLDGFKAVNDTLGHDAGDELLVEVGNRLKSLVRATDVVARFGGDEFVILAPRLPQREDIFPLAERVLWRLAEPMQVHGQQLRIGASLGLAFHPHDGLDVDTLLKHSDMALYSAKTGGRGIYRCFDDRLAHAVTEHRMLEIELRRALDAEGLEVFYQPKFDAKSLEIVGFEALARWRHPTRGNVPPDVFIRMAEDCGLINRLGRWILEQACESVASWQPRLPVAVNVSVLQLHDSGLKDAISAALAQNGLGPEHLAIEVTESVVAGYDLTVLGNLQAIKAMGISIALDDFGTGYSSLSYLRRFSFDKIKIDKAFVQDQADDPGVRVILEAILDMCHNLGLATIAEGVETLEQLALLQARGCTEIQGYLLGRPMPGDQVQDFIRSTFRKPDMS